MNDSPRVIAVGALGGSGTRAVAEILIKAGVFMGDMLNVANDNILFSKLFKNPTWFRSAGPAQIDGRLSVFEGLMLRRPIGARGLATVFVAAASNRVSMARPSFYYQVLQRAFGGERNEQRTAWGWKEPNTHLYLEHLVRRYPTLRYVHVIRHGLDMAYSGNRNQLRYWGHLYDIHVNGRESPEELAGKQLEYWIRSNREAIEKGERLLGDKFYLLNHSRLCDEPKVEVPRLLSHLGVEVDDALMPELIAVPKVPSSMNRYQRNDNDCFSQGQLQAVSELGFPLT